MGGDGARWQGHSQRFVARADTGTRVIELKRKGGPMLRSRVIPGGFGIPAVTYAGDAELIPAASTSLVLATGATTASPRHTDFAVVSTRDLRVRRLIRLRGAFAFDALSPDGATAYLIQHTSASSITRYVVRAYDLRRGRLVPGVIADRSTGEWKMDGLPIARLQSGVWAYTLYGNGEREGPFVHALDTRTGTAHCIDLPRLRPRNIWMVRLRMASGGRLLAVEGKRTLAAIDTGRFRETAARTPARPTEASSSSSSRAPVAALGALALVLAGAGAAGVRRSRRAERR